TTSAARPTPPRPSTTPRWVSWRSTSTPSTSRPAHRATSSSSTTPPPPRPPVRSCSSSPRCRRPRATRPSSGPPSGTQLLGEPDELALALELGAALVLVEGVDLDVHVRPAVVVGRRVHRRGRADRVHQRHRVQRRRR